MILKEDTKVINLGQSIKTVLFLGELRYVVTLVLNKFLIISSSFINHFLRQRQSLEILLFTYLWCIMPNYQEHWRGDANHLVRTVPGLALLSR